jgi:hypothetical protein
MVRTASPLPIFLVILSPALFAQTPPETDPRISRAIGVQKAMSEAKELLRANRPADAVAVLEAEILYVNGNSSYLALMKDAYIAFLKTAGQNDSTERIEHARRQLRILAPDLRPDEIADVPDKPRMPIIRGGSEDDDPFQQQPLDRSAAKDIKARASAAFDEKRYAEAAMLFKQAQAARIELSEQERQAWAYCRLHDVTAQLNKGGASLAALEAEADDAIKAGGPQLEPFGNQVLSEIRKRKTNADGPAAVPDGWQVIDAGNFRVFYRQSRQQASEIARLAEQARTTTFEKWSGPAGATWSPRCDLWLHSTAAEYAKITEKPANSPGHSSVGIKGGQVVARRIDLHCDDTTLADVTLPREVAYVAIAEMFADQPLPRWAEIGMTTLSGSAADVSRYLRAMPSLLRDRKLIPVHDLLKATDFPSAEKITAYYVGSVSLVDYLVRLKGPKAFALYLRESPRRGYEDALQRHYGFKDAKELQEKWLKSVAGND